MGRLARLTPLAIVLVIGLPIGLAAAPSGCGGGQSSETASPPEPEDDKEVSERGKKWGGWRWKGKRDNCFFIHDNECYAERKAACRAAGCGEKDCEHDDGAPAKVSCKK